MPSDKMTRPDHPRPEVAALATALWNAGVDMDALTERVAQAMSGYGNPTIDWHREARRLLGGGRT